MVREQVRKLDYDDEGDSINAKAKRPGRILVQTLDQTWQAYNNYGAPSTYAVNALPHHGPFIKVSGLKNRTHSTHQMPGLESTEMP